MTVKHYVIALQQAFVTGEGLAEVGTVISSHSERCGTAGSRRRGAQRPRRLMRRSLCCIDRLNPPPHTRLTGTDARMTAQAEDESIDEGAVWSFHSETCRWNRDDPTVGNGSAKSIRFPQRQRLAADEFD
ncbi:hypothetical protein [Paraburkholderia sp. Cpub6]|uniref:hypothetical protein n=2 Tax=unclassified Paraburkholderia TaxID=2615204 RepID=UPI00161B6DDB|nr:hypothetical protein [Paraburkholderia sp. Cpub6]MBB5462846.1 hypothetical protein [Paraburkholderia sp. Cpub6]